MFGDDESMSKDTVQYEVDQRLPDTKCISFNLLVPSHAEANLT